MSRRISKEEAEALLNRYRAGKCTPRELEILKRWYRSYDEVEVPGLDNPETQEVIKSAMRENINKHIRGQRKNRRARGGLVLWRSHIPDVVSWAAAAVLLVGVGVGFYFYSGDTLSLRDRGVASNLEGTSSATNKIIQSSAPVLYLSDGSVIWLKGDSRLEFPEQFDGIRREVTLIGEAFFDVARDADRPFIIHSPNFTTKVLGTTFNIKDDGNQDLPEVAVVSGKVMVSLDHSDQGKVQQLVLRPNQKAIYSRKENTLLETQVRDSEVDTASKRKFLFENTRLTDIINVLNAEHDVNIHLSHQALNGCLITADLTGLNLRVGLEALSKAINGTYSVDGREIVISGPGCEIQP